MLTFMIRRHVGHEWWLFAQQDHAQLAGDFAAQLGGAIRPLTPAAAAAVRWHDLGWVEGDAAPALNTHGQPRDVFETALPRAMEIWRQSSVNAHRQLGDYGGLLVSCHSLALSAVASGRVFAQQAGRTPDLRLHFLVNKFQHAEVELQEQIRRRLSMRLDAPLTIGLALESIEPLEQQLIYDYRWLAAMDQLSLDLCCTSVLFPTLAHVAAAPGATETPFHVTRVDHGRACVRPWPFAVATVNATIPFRRLASTIFAREEVMRAAVEAAPLEHLAVELFPASPLAATA